MLKFKKIFVFVAMVLIFSLSCVACGKNDNNSDKGVTESNVEDNSTETAVTEIEDDTVVTEGITEADTSEDSEPGVYEPLTPPPTDLSENIEDLEFYLDGKKYKLPMEPGVIPDGWELTRELVDSEKTIGPKEQHSIIFKDPSHPDNNLYITAMFRNNTDSTINTLDGQIYSLTFDIEAITDPSKAPELYLPKGVTWYTAQDEVRSLYGDPQYPDSLNYDYYFEYEDHSVCIQLWFNDDKQLTYVSMQYTMNYGY